MEKNRISLRINKDLHLQSGKIRSEKDTFDNIYTKFSLREANLIDQIIQLDFMGHNEFECDKLDKSLERIGLNWPFYKIIVFDEYKNDIGQPLKVIFPIIYLNKIKGIIDSLFSQKANLLTRLDLEKEISYYKKDFFWDVDNDFILFFGDEKKIIDILNINYQQSNQELTEKLRKHYIKVIEEENALAFTYKSLKVKPKIDEKSKTIIYRPIGIDIRYMTYISTILAHLYGYNISFNANGTIITVPYNFFDKKDYYYDIDKAIKDLYSSYFDEINENENENEKELMRKREELTIILKKIANKRK